MQVALLGVMSGIQTADPTIASTALVESARALGMDAGVQTIAASISTLMLAATVISTGLLADRIGRKLLLILALLTSILGDLIAAAAFDPIMYMAGRALAGIGLGAVFGAAFAYIRAVVPQAKLASAMGAFAAYGAIAMIAASFVGGSMASLDWRLSFLVVPILCALCLVAVLFVLPVQSKTGSGPADVGGQILLALGIIGVLYGVSHAGAGLTSPLTWAPFLLGIVLLVVFAVVERKQTAFFPLDLFRNPGFIAAIGMGVAFNIAQAVAILQFANIWQFVYGFHTLEVSLAQLPMTLVSVVASVLLGRMLTKGMSPATAVAITAGATTIGFLSLALTFLSDSFWLFLPALVLIGFGMSGLVPYGALVIRIAPPAHFGAVTSSRTTIGQFGYAVGLSVSMVLVDALTTGGVIHKLEAAGVPPTRTGQALDAIQQYTQHGTVPSSAEGGTALLSAAADSYHVAFFWVAVITAVVVAALALMTIVSYRRWAAIEATKAPAAA
ncbi:MFS transporter [Microbacterium sediminicola]|uniref:MFS-type drug efflux transporter P55 n=1 Tax=Microbacterium sediminicola TaxID=415210 RepID=A0ABP4TL14_9MICO